MPEPSKVRRPQQKRSIEKKERILAAAEALFSEKGFFKTSTPEIAAKAQVSTGCLYSYFTDKHMIFMELLGHVVSEFDALIDSLEGWLRHPDLDFRAYFRAFFLRMIEIHVKFRPLLLESDTLLHTDADVRAQMEARQKKIQGNLLRMMRQYQSLFRVDDLEAAAVVLYELVDALVDRIAFTDNALADERIVNEGLQAVCRYLRIEPAVE